MFINSPKWSGRRHTTQLAHWTTEHLRKRGGLAHLFDVFKYPRKLLVDGQAASLDVPPQVPPGAQTVLREEHRQGLQRLQHLLERCYNTEHRTTSQEQPEENKPDVDITIAGCMKILRRFQTGVQAASYKYSASPCIIACVLIYFVNTVYLWNL